MIVKNYSQLLLEELNKSQKNFRKIGLESLEKAINAVKPSVLIERSVKIQEDLLIIDNDKYNLNEYKKIIIIGAGKATAEMAFALEKMLFNYSKIPFEGIINIPDNLKICKSDLIGKIKINYASHPIPDENGLKGTKRMMELINKTNDRDLVLFLISGGGSALLPLPKKGITLEDLKEVNSLLLASGASIHEINAIRKHLSDFKGGNLAKTLYNASKATLISLIISDVVGDNLDSIASGPTVPDLTSFQEAINILKRYNIYEKIPSGVKNLLEKGLGKKIDENPKPNDICFDNSYNYLIGSVNLAANEALSYLKDTSYYCEYFSDNIIGESREFGYSLYDIIIRKTKNYIEQNKKNKIALIGTGELTVTIKGNGIGGRNQEMLLGFLDFIKNKNFNKDFLIIAANLDGIEGNSKAMGALIDNSTLNQVIKEDLDTKKYLNNNDSNSFFKKVESEIITGPTGCNVNDLIIILIQ